MRSLQWYLLLPAIISPVASFVPPYIGSTAAVRVLGSNGVAVGYALARPRRSSLASTRMCMAGSASESQGSDFRDLFLSSVRNLLRSVAVALAAAIIVLQASIGLKDMSQGSDKSKTTPAAPVAERRVTSATDDATMTKRNSKAILMLSAGSGAALVAHSVLSAMNYKESPTYKTRH